MHRFRTAWGMRVLALVMGASMLLAATAPVARASRAVAAMPLADWLRNQLRVPAGEAFEKALATATSTRPHSLRDFLAAFIDAFEAQHPGVAVGAAFTGSDCSEEALIRYLQQRYHRLVDDAVLPTTVLAPLPVPQSKTPDRYSGAAENIRPEGLSAPPAAATGLHFDVRHGIRALRIQSAAQPQGP